MLEFEEIYTNVIGNITRHTINSNLPDKVAQIARFIKILIEKKYCEVYVAGYAS